MALQKTQSQRVVFKQTLSVQSQTLPLPTVTVFTRVWHTETSIVLQDSATRAAPPSQPKWHWKIWKTEEAPVVTLPLDLVMFQNLFKVNFGYFKTVTQSCGCHTLVTALTYGVTEMLTERSFKYFILLLSFRLYCVQRRFPERREAQE